MNEQRKSSVNEQAMLKQSRDHLLQTSDQHENPKDLRENVFHEEDEEKMHLLQYPQVPYHALRENEQEKKAKPPSTLLDFCSYTEQKAVRYIASLLPIVRWAPAYRQGWVAKLKGDIAAGITVGILLIPQGMAYAMLAGMPAIYGLYSSIVPICVYCILGSSYHLSIGPFAIVSLMISSVIGSMAVPETEDYIELVLILSMTVGVMLLIMGFLKLGFITNFLSKPVLEGFTTASGVMIAASQLKNVFGINQPRSEMFSDTMIDFLVRLPETRAWTLLFSLLCFAILIGLNHLNQMQKKVFIPNSLVVVIIGIAIVYTLETYATNTLALVGPIPKGLPPLSLPPIFTHYTDFTNLIPGAAITALVSFISAFSVAKKIAEDKKYDIDGNQELIALGACNLLGSFTSAFPVGAGMARTMVNVKSGAQTQIASLIAAIVVSSTLLVLAPVFEYLPNAALGAIILVAVYPLINFLEVIHLWRVNKIDAISWIVTFFSTLALGIANGILIAAVFSIILVVGITSRPTTVMLGRFPQSTTYRNVKRFPQVLVIPGLMVVRCDTSLYFYNITYTKDKLRHWFEKRKPRCVVFDWSAINDIDATACQQLCELLQWLKNQHTIVIMASVKGPVRDMLLRCHVVSLVGKDNFYWELHDAVCQGYLSMDKTGLNLDLEILVEDDLVMPTFVEPEAPQVVEPIASPPTTAAPRLSRMQSRSSSRLFSPKIFDLENPSEPTNT